MSMMVKWCLTTSAYYNSLETKEPNFLYFLDDTKEIYRGDVEYTNAVNIVDEYPELAAKGKLYVLSSTLESKIWTGTEWKTVSPGVSTVLTDEDVVNGTVKVSGIKAGNATLAEDANANTLATEAAVAAIRATLEGSISTKVAKSDITTSISAVGSASDSKVASEKAVAQAIEKLNGDKVNKTDVIAEVSVDSNSATKVASEAAVIAAMSWVTLN